MAMTEAIVAGGTAVNSTVAAGFAGMTGLLNQLTPTLIQTVAAGKVIGIWYIFIIGVIPFLSLVFKGIITYLSIKLIVTAIVNTIHYFYGEDADETTKKKN
jgi:hypothetical protein